MIQNPFILSILLFGLVAGILWLEKAPSLHKLFHYLPAPFWCYFVPVTLATFGLLPAQSPIYTFLTTYVLCACLLLLLLNVNLPAILRLGPAALGALAAGTFGISLGAVISYAIFARWLPPETWKGVGSLSASWTGGSANMLAVKEALTMSDSAFAPFVIVDTVMTYAWMGLMIALAPWQSAWDARVQAHRSALDDSIQRMKDAGQSSLSRASFSWWHGGWLLALGLAGAWLCFTLADRIPYKGAVLSTNGWAFILASIAGILLSLTPAKHLDRFGTARTGYFCLYLLLAAIGARARFQDIWHTPVLLALAIVLVLIHAIVLAAYGYMKRLPMFFLVSASQANIGGTASAPIVAGIYQPALAPVGLLLAISANVYGTYLGLLIAQACHWVY